MKYLFCALFLLLLAKPQAQNLRYGAGITSNIAWFQHEVEPTIDTFNFASLLAKPLGIQAFIDLGNKSAFQARIQAHFNSKNMNFSLANNNLIEDFFIKRIYSYRFTSIDLSISGRYKIASSPTGWQVFPKIGLGLSWNTYRTSIYGTSSSFPISGRVPDIEDIGVEVEDATPFLRPILQMGVGVQPPLYVFKRRLEFTTNFQYMPTQFLKMPIPVTPFSVNGKYQMVSLGINLLFNEKKQ
jgi:hypothetical protein